MAEEPKLRRAARLLVVDSRNRVLLVQYARSSGQRYWATPGGGLEDGETFEEAAAREALEELGVRNPTLAALSAKTADFEFVDGEVHQMEKFFFLHLESLEFDAQVREAHDREGILEARWWSLADLSNSNESIFPDKLAEIVGRARRGQPSN
jgi:8-oxo-dGTP diphosphatase